MVPTISQKPTLEVQQLREQTQQWTEEIILIKSQENLK